MTVRRYSVTLLGSMPNEDILNIQYTLEQHKGDLDKLADRIWTLEHDLRLIFSFPGPLNSQIITSANQIGNSAFDQTRAKQCADLVKRYGLSVE